MNIRKIKSEDSTQLFNWVNKTDSLSVKVENQKKINFSAHSKWFSERMNDPNTSIWIIENKNKIPIGQIRFQKKMDNYFDVDIYLTKHERKKGVASKALNLAINKVNFYSFRAIIKKSNRRSYNFFLKNGFSLSHEDNNMWVLVNIIK